MLGGWILFCLLEILVKIRFPQTFQYSRKTAEFSCHTITLMHECLIYVDALFQLQISILSIKADSLKSAVFDASWKNVNLELGAYNNKDFMLCMNVSHSM